MGGCLVGASYCEVWLDLRGIFDLGVESCLMGGVVVGAIMFWGNW